MFSAENYQLIDFGEGRRLERFGPLVLDRPCPSAEGLPRDDPSAWGRADARFQRTRGDEGRWIDARGLPPRWTVAYGPLVLELKRTEFGQVGLFPEQQVNWDWILAAAPRIAPAQKYVRLSSLTEQTGQAGKPDVPVRVLHLFAYTGAATLAAAAAGAEVTHVDAARMAVAGARRNAVLSGLSAAKIRWIVEDALKYAARELKRGSRYDAVILDPPSYGHGPDGEPWVIEKQLPRLLEICGQLTAGRRRWVLLTCHTPQLGTECLRSMLAEALDAGGPGLLTAGPLTLPAAGGRHLPSGVVVRWEAMDA
jgi:23S rRNA (cytosine1962-C5)-methyltransferase